MRADWPHPSFQGRFLPAKHAIGPNGFTASWKISRFAAQGAGQAASCAFPCNRMGEQISVSLIEPVGLYQQLERASKYGFLFIGLTFAAFLLFELLRRKAYDDSLLGGSRLLFGLLAALMIATRRVDWYGLGSPRPAASG